jgi:BTB/POZ domain
VPEKDADDPSSAAGSVEQNHLQTSTAISRLLVASESLTPGVASRDPRSSRNVNDTATLSGHLLHRGFIDGRHSDITIRAFGQEYKLHKLILDRVPFFSSAFSGSWAESAQDTMQLWPEDIDTNITRSAFELALRRIYGAHQAQQEDQEAIGLFATACWLDMADLVDSSVDPLLRQMHPSKLHILIKLVTTNCYGQAGDRVLSSAKAMLFREGWEMPYEYWDGIPTEIIREIIGGDPFYVPGEWERWYLALRLLNRRLKAKAIEAGLVSANGSYLQPRPRTLKFFAMRFDPTYRRDSGLVGRHVGEGDDAWVSLYTSPEIAPLLVLLDEGIYYVHLRFEQLQQIRIQRDILGVPVLPEKIISNALWMSMELRQRVVNAHENDLELGLSEIAEEFVDESRRQDAAGRSSYTKGKEREGLAEESSEVESGSWDGNGKPRKFWIPCSDISRIMGGSREPALAGNSMAGAEWTTSANRLSAILDPSDVTWAVDFTGTVPGVCAPLSRSTQSHQAPRFSRFPPFRFSAEFPNPRTLKERKRTYSQTVSYAGSMWNLYIQRVNTSKNQQLGIYLHRAKDKDPSGEPLAQLTPATVDDRIGQLEREMLLRKERRNRHWRTEVIASGGEADREDDSSGSGPDFDGMAPSDTLDPSIRISGTASLLQRGDASGARVHKTSQIPNSLKPHATAMLNQLLDSDDENEDLARSSRRYNVSAMPPYVDGRPTIKTYFKIYSPSKAGRMLSIYESAPDHFNFAQSWGWKSSQMVLDDGMGAYEGTKGAKDGKLRYMVVIGNV